MRKSYQMFILLFLINASQGQQLFSTGQDVENHWSDYTSFQRDEMVSFCDFLFQEQHYERCILTSFQLLYKFPEDEISSSLHYYIARSYEELQNYELAIRYYNLAKKLNQNDRITLNASEYRKQLVYLKSQQIERVIEETEKTDDPYLLTFRGYAFLMNQEWELARSTLIIAEQKFNHSFYSDLMMPLYQAIEEVETVPRHNKIMVPLFGSIFPGGGQFVLKDWSKGKGVLATIGLLYVTTQWTSVGGLKSTNRLIEPEGSSIPKNNQIKELNGQMALGGGKKIPGDFPINSTSLKYSLPPLFFIVGIYGGSIWKSYSETSSTNHQLIFYYLQERLALSSPERFIDFPEPILKSEP